ncbi:hypothetical protein AMTR_s00148p00093230 [Amborella trichopoda]|uniref:Uncharacterized protein n=1 Tax=Amborella trichopoda TaxID=13333 RepID=W1PL50_AMBTC|nr:hypothetical protein AMTR_s00148p00093230 [Amborella trichopoda]
MRIQKPRFTSNFHGRRAFPFSSPPISYANPASLEPLLNRAPPPPPSFNGIPLQNLQFVLQISAQLTSNHGSTSNSDFLCNCFGAFFLWKSSTWGLWTKPTFLFFSFRPQSTSSCYYTIFYAFKAFFPWKFSCRPAMAQAFAPPGLPTMIAP